MKKLLNALVLIVLIVPGLFPQEMDSIEVYLLDAYVTPELPHTFHLSFFTSDLCRSRVVIDDNYEYNVSDDPLDMHNFEIEITDLEFSGKIVNFIIITKNDEGSEFASEVFDFDLPYEPTAKEGSDLLQVCLFGTAIFLLPYPSLVLNRDETYFSLTKEIPIISLRSKSRRYPAGYLSLEYSHIFEAENNNYLRAGYKQFYELPHIEYILPGVTLYTNFLGNNGIGLEASVGLFTIVDTFTLYARYRYNLKPGGSAGSFHEVSLGLYSSFFSLYL